MSGQIIFLAVAVAVAASVTLCAGGQGHAVRRSPPPPVAPLPQGYLLRAGPPCLRFESAGNVNEKIAPTQYSPAKSSPSKTEAPAPPAENFADTRNQFPTPTNAAPVMSTVIKADSTAAPASSPMPGIAPDVTDPSIVTSAMLADYLKPSSSGKNNNNSPAVVVPVKAGFTPPTSAADNQSRAVYKSE